MLKKIYFYLLGAVVKVASSFFVDLAEQCYDFYLSNAHCNDTSEDNEEQINTLACIHLFSSQCVKFIVDSMELYHDKPVLLTHILRTMKECSKNQIFADQLLDYGAMNLLLEKMKLFRSDCHIQILAMESLTNTKATQEDEG